MRIALVENFGRDFLYFRLPLVKFLESKGFVVYAIVPEDSYYKDLLEKKINVITFPLAKNKLNPVAFIRAVFILRRIQKEKDISIFHSFRFQPNIITNFALGFRKDVKVINHITGLGYAFTKLGFNSFFYRILILLLYQSTLPFIGRIIVQNRDDLSILSRLFFIKNKLVLIQGSGINIDKFSRENVDFTKVNKLKKILNCDNFKIVTFIGRLLKDKGIVEFLKAAEIITKENDNVKFAIAGWIDKFNPSCISIDLLNKYLSNNKIIYIHEINEVRELLYLTDIFVLPTYREGFPRSVLEAMAMEVPVISTSVPGVREAIVHNFNGILVKPGNETELVNAIKLLIYNDKLAKFLGKNGRHQTKVNFRDDLIFNKVLNVYKALL